MKKLFTISIIIFLVTLFGCKNDTIQIIDPPLALPSSGIIVVNEGLFSQNNATLTYYSIVDGSVSNGIYSMANSNNKLGDTANDIKILNDKGFIAVDQSFKIEVIDINTFNSLGMIDLTNYGEPRKLSIVDSTMGFVTVWNSSGDGVVKFNPTTLVVEGLVSVGAKPEGIVYNGNYLYTANSGWGADSTVSVIDAAQFKVIKTLTVGVNPVNVIENNNWIYVISSGTFGGNGVGSVYKINPNTLKVTDFSNVPGNPGKATVINDELLAINNTGIIKISLNDLSISDSTFIKGTEVNSLFGTIYSIAFDASSGMIYLGNPKDFQQPGEVAVYDISGSEIKRFSCGINPGTIVVKK